MESRHLKRQKCDTENISSSSIEAAVPAVAVAAAPSVTAVAAPSVTAVAAPSVTSADDYLKCMSISPFDGLNIDMYLDSHNCTQCSNCIPILSYNKIISEDLISSFIESLKNPSIDVVISSLIELKNEITKNGKLARNQVIETELLIKQIIYLCMNSPNLRVREYVCHLLFIITKKNNKMLEFIFGNIEIVNRFKWFISQSIIHGKEHSCNSECICEENGITTCLIEVIGKNAMWILGSVCDEYDPITQIIIFDKEFHESIYEYINHDNDMIKSSAAYLIHNSIKKNDQLRKIMSQTPVIDYLINILNTGNMYTKIIACYTIFSLFNNDIQFTLDIVTTKGIIELINRLIRELNDSPYTQQWLIWLISRLCDNNETILTTLSTNHIQIQNEIREKGIIHTILYILDSPINIFVKTQAISSIYYICKRNTENQTLIGELGIIEKLFALLPIKGQVYLVKTVQSIFSAIISLAIHHTVNINKIFNITNSIPTILQFLSTTFPGNIQAIVCALIRILIKNDDIQLNFVVHGIFPALVNLISSHDHEIQEHAIAAILTLISPTMSPPTESVHVLRTHVINIHLLHVLKCHIKLCNILEDNTKSTIPTYGYTIMCIFKLCEKNESICDEIRMRPDTIGALMRISKSPNVKLKSFSVQLLQKILPDIQINPLSYMKLMLCAFKTFTPLCACDQDCSICMEAEIKETVFLPCFHKFHKECISQWFNEGHFTCPTCKTNVIEDTNNLIGIKK